VRLYYFTGANYGLDALRDRRLKLALIHQLNDPFDFAALALPNPADRKFAKMLYDRFARTVGMLCMSKDWKHPLLWSHYAGKHSGLCLGFDVRQNQWQEVTYVPARPTLDDFGVRTYGEVTVEAFSKLCRIKFDAWAYEQEYRSIANLGEPDAANGLHFLDFENALILREVIVGERCTVGRGQVSRLIEKYEQPVDTFKARCSFKNFEVVRQKSKRMWKD